MVSILSAGLLLLVLVGGLILVFKKVMDKSITSATKHLDELNQAYTKKEEEVNRQLEEVKQKSQELLNKAKDEAENLKAQIVKEAEGERDKMINAARTQSEEIMQKAEKSRQTLINELEERISKEAIKKASVLIQDTLPEEFKQLVHRQWVEDLIEHGFSQIERLRIPQDLGEVKIVSAFALSDEQRKKITKKLKDALGRELVLKEEVDPKVIAGIVISLGSLVLDGSLKNKIQEKAR